MILSLNLSIFKRDFTPSFFNFQKKGYAMSGIPRIKVAAFAGGVNGSQLEAFTIAFADVKLSVASKVEIVLELTTNKNIHENLMSEEELFDQLSDADLYFILGHVHQGNPQWSAITIQDLLLKLRGHLGWPEWKHLRCPILTQDKHKYLKSCHMISIPTLKLDFDRVDFTAEVLEFADSNDEGCGWVLKLPFTTNGEGLKFCKTPADVIKQAHKNAVDFGHRMSYSMLQPCLANRKEYKVAVVDGKATFVADINQRASLGQPFSKAPHRELKTFAEHCCDILESFGDGALIHPLLRVDIMQTVNGMVVNEFESLEACFYSKQFDKFELQTHDYLRKYWTRTIGFLVTEFIHSRPLDVTTLTSPRNGGEPPAKKRKARCDDADS